MSAPISVDELTAALVKQGMVRADVAPAAWERSGTDRPWFISMMLGMAGWLAGGLTLVFAAQLFTPSNAVEYAVIGAVLLGAAFVLYVVDKDSAFFDQFALALSIAGQFAVVGAFGEATHSEAGTALLVFLMQCVLLIVMPNRTARLLAAVFACIAWALAVRLGFWDDHPLGDSSSVPSLAPVIAGWCVSWLPVLTATWVLTANEARWMAGGLPRLLRPLLTGMLLCLALGTIVSAPTESFDFWMGDVGMRANWLMTWPLLSLSCSLFAAFCAFRIRHHALLGAAVAGALLYVLDFYFLLGATLLTKSVIMLAMGAAFLAGSVILNRRSGGAPR
jgi:hypothetical protein